MIIKNLHFNKIDIYQTGKVKMKIHMRSIKFGSTINCKPHISNIVAISGALFTLRIQYEYTQTQYDEGARDGIDIWYMRIISYKPVVWGCFAHRLRLGEFFGILPTYAVFWLNSLGPRRFFENSQSQRTFIFNNLRMKNNSRNWGFKSFGDFGRFWWIGWYLHFYNWKQFEKN